MNLSLVDILSLRSRALMKVNQLIHFHFRRARQKCFKSAAVNKFPNQITLLSEMNKQRRVRRLIVKVRGEAFYFLHVIRRKKLPASGEK